MKPVNEQYELFHKETGEVVGRNSRMIGADHREYLFRGFSRGRIGPKILVHDVEKNFNREFFPNVFPEFEIRELPDAKSN